MPRQFANKERKNRNRKNERFVRLCCGGLSTGWINWKNAIWVNIKSMANSIWIIQFWLQLKWCEHKKFTFAITNRHCVYYFIPIILGHSVSATVCMCVVYTDTRVFPRKVVYFLKAIRIGVLIKLIQESFFFHLHIDRHSIYFYFLLVWAVCNQNIRKIHLWVGVCVSSFFIYCPHQATDIANILQRSKNSWNDFVVILVLWAYKMLTSLSSFFATIRWHNTLA